MIAGCPGILYSSSAHFPRSINWHRSEQKGRLGFPSHSAGVPHVGHLTFLTIPLNHLLDAEMITKKSIEFQFDTLAKFWFTRLDKLRRYAIFFAHVSPPLRRKQNVDI